MQNYYVSIGYGHGKTLAEHLGITLQNVMVPLDWWIDVPEWAYNYIRENQNFDVRITLR
jgi:hypothetical protein